MIHFLVPRGQEFGVLYFAEDHARGILDRVSITNYEDLDYPSPSGMGTCILAALDQLTPEGLGYVREWSDQLRGRCPTVRVLNDPRTTLCRFDLLDTLYNLGLNRHRVIRSTSSLDDLRFPVFIRNEHFHSGALSPLLNTASELQVALTRAALLGHSREDLLVVEFVETRQEDGYYRKYAAHIVGEKIISRGLAVGGDWMLKAGGSQRTRSTVLEQRAYVFENPHEAELRELFAIANTEYGRIDYGIMDGKIETWEINLNPTLGRGIGPRRPRDFPPDVEAMREEVQRYIAAQFEEAFSQIDLPSPTEALEVADSLSRSGARPRRMVRQPVRESRSIAWLRRIPVFRSVLGRLFRFGAVVLTRIAGWFHRSPGR